MKKKQRNIHSATTRHHHSPPPPPITAAGATRYHPSRLPQYLHADAVVLSSMLLPDYGGPDCCHGSNLRVARFYYSSHYVLPFYTRGNSNYYFKEEDLTTRRKEGKTYNINKFIQFVDASLQRFCEAKVSLQKFRLYMMVFDVEIDSSLLDKWIELVVANEIKELDFNLLPDKNRMYSLPATIFSAKFLTTLKLSTCNLEQSSAYTIRFHSLKKLELIAVHIDEQMVHKFISECPLLEDLFLSICWHCKHIRISHASKLKFLTIGFSSHFCAYDALFDVESIEIVAPSLQQCTLVCVQRSCVTDMVRCADLKYLSLISAGILDQELQNLISKFPLLEKLTVHGCALKRVSLSNNRLKELQVLSCTRLRVIDIDVPSLLTFTYGFFCNPARSINVPRSCSWEVRFSLHRHGNDVLISLDRIKKFLEVPYDIEELSLSIFIEDMDSYVLDKFKKRSPSLPREVGNLTIDVLDLQPSNYATLLDSLLWICFPRTLSIKSYQSSFEFIMWFYKKMIKRDAKCCNCHGIKCWQHYLKDFKIESFVPLKDPKPLRIDNLYALPKLRQGTIRFRLDWCFSEQIDLA
ncbi:hypothetical protein QYF36_013865 [Acer negundo]|nr:hypothetical protein QYF36_013865 [Acer negundo]